MFWNPNIRLRWRFLRLLSLALKERVENWYLSWNHPIFIILPLYLELTGENGKPFVLFVNNNNNTKIQLGAMTETSTSGKRECECLHADCQDLFSIIHRLPQINTKFYHVLWCLNDYIQTSQRPKNRPRTFSVSPALLFKHRLLLF